MKNYLKPEILISEFNLTDVILTSGGGLKDGEEGGGTGTIVIPNPVSETADYWGNLTPNA